MIVPVGATGFDELLLLLLPGFFELELELFFVDDILNYLFIQQYIN